ncbi:MAG TPA: DEAD/DEAH box helicase [Acidimicrobiales bacterium]|nr:DEAD/DEAH box helicase [Acidimicrobiales bacterium]
MCSARGIQPAWACSNSHPELAISSTRTEFDISSFIDLGVDAPIVRRLDDLGITDPLPIQSATIPEALAGRDICGQAPTGSGKTLAFGVPLVSGATAAEPRRPVGLVLVPTRELADQVRGVLANLMGKRAQRVVALYGGTAYGPQRQSLRRGADIVVACPGRLEDLVERGDVQLRDVRTVVLDEADRMVDMGFVRPVRRLLDQTAPNRQVLLFSATMGKEVEAISRKYQRDPARYQIENEPSETPDVTHHFWSVPRADRAQLTAELVARHGQAFVFCRTKQGADRVARQLRSAGIDSAPIHGDRSQSQRARALASFASGRTRALVGTDVVARGIHVDDVPCVVHFDPPGDAESYVHRSGRTGRAGSAGTVVSLVPHEQQAEVRTLMRELGFSAAVTEPFETAASRLRPRRASDAARANRPKGQAHPKPSRRQKASSSRLRGTVTSFDKRRGYGFIAGPDGTDVFVHHSTLRRNGSSRAFLREGERVDFELGAGRRGREARNVEVAESVAS